MNTVGTINNFRFSTDIDATRKIDGICSFLPAMKEKRPIAIVLHGFKGNAEWGFLPLIRNVFALNKYYSVSYNHSLNGFIQDSDKLDVNKFRKMTISKQVTELMFLVNSIENNSLPAPLDTEHWNGKILLCGHSMGASVSLVFAHEHPDMVSRLAMIAPIASFYRYYSERQIEKWKHDGKLEFQNARTGQQLILDINFLNDFLINRERFDLAKAIAETRIPIIIAHGETDLTSKIAESEFLYSHSDKTKTQFFTFPQCNHLFNFDMENDPKKNIALAGLLDKLKSFSTL